MKELAAEVLGDLEIARRELAKGLVRFAETKEDRPFILNNENPNNCVEDESSGDEDDFSNRSSMLRSPS